MILLDLDKIKINNMIELKYILKLLIHNNIFLGLVTHESYDNIIERFGNNIFTYIFSDSGTILHMNNKIIFYKNILDCYDRKIINNVISRALMVISSMPIIFNSGFVNIKNGSIYVNPIGIHATQHEKNIYHESNDKYLLNNRLETQIKSSNRFDDYFIVMRNKIGCTIYLKNWNKTNIVDNIPVGIFDRIYYFKKYNQKINIIENKNTVFDVISYDELIKLINELFLNKFV